MPGASDADGDGDEPGDGVTVGATSESGVTDGDGVGVVIASNSTSCVSRSNGRSTRSTTCAQPFRPKMFADDTVALRDFSMSTTTPSINEMLTLASVHRLRLATSLSYENASRSWWKRRMSSVCASPGTFSNCARPSERALMMAELSETSTARESRNSRRARSANASSLGASTVTRLDTRVSSGPNPRASSRVASTPNPPRTRSVFRTSRTGSETCAPSTPSAVEAGRASELFS